MKKLLILLLSLCMTLSLTACAQKPENAVKSTLDCLKSGKLEKLSEYVVSTEEISIEDYEKYKDIYETIFKDLSYEIGEVEKTDDNTAYVRTKITARDMKPVISAAIADLFAWAMEMAFSGTDVSDEEVENKAMEIIVSKMSDSQGEKVTTEVDIKVIKDEKNKWRVNLDDEVLDALLGGLISGLQSF